MDKACPCGSGKLFNKCCDRFLAKKGENKPKPKTPEQLMRSRYSAYALGGYGEYLLATWLPSMAQHLSVDELSAVTHQWVGLEIIQKAQSGNDGFVEFRASFIDGDGKESVLHEKSVFKRIGGVWLYVGGEVN